MAVIIIAGTTHMDLSPQNRKLVYKKRDEENMRGVRKQVKEDTMAIFEEIIKSSDVSRWTTRLIPGIKK